MSVLAILLPFIAAVFTAIWPNIWECRKQRQAQKSAQANPPTTEAATTEAMQADCLSSFPFGFRLSQVESSNSGLWHGIFWALEELPL